MIKKLMQELEKNGNEQSKKIYINHGAKEPLFGVKHDFLKKYAKANKDVDISIVMELMATKNIDAQYLALYIINWSKRHKELASQDYEFILDHVDNYSSREYILSPLIGLADRGDIIAQYIKDPTNEARASVGYGTIGSLLRNNREYDGALIEQVLKDSEQIHSYPNRVRYALNGAIIAIGTYLTKYHSLATLAAQKYGLVTAKVGNTACKVPSALEYIPRAYERANKRAEYKRYYGC